MATDIQAPKGTRDIDGREAVLFTDLETAARAVFRSHGYREVRTPIFESLDLFARSLGDTSDVVEKEMFAFQDRGERTFALRPEGTAGIVRYFIEQNLSVKGGHHRLFYMGPMFRAERPQAGRYRQFYQIGGEYFGDPSPAADADTILIAARILREFGLKDFRIQINTLGSTESRARYRDVLSAYLEKKRDVLTDESRRRMAVNPMRVLDSKADGPKLSDAPLVRDYLDADCRRHYEEVKTMLAEAGVSLEENPRLVRGLDYYTRTVFEFISPDLGAQNALAAGGRYDNLVSHLGGPSVPGVGFALGMDRLVAARRQGAPDPSAAPVDDALVSVTPLTDAGLPAAFSLAARLRRAGYAVPSVVCRRKLKSVLSQAVEMGARWAILMGDDELQNGTATVKDLISREQETVPLKEAEAVLARRRG